MTQPPFEDSSIYKQNLDQFNQKLDEKEVLDSKDLLRYRYYADLYGNEYRWYTNKQDDGKFMARIYKISKHPYIKNAHRKELKQERRFAKRKTAKSWCLSNCLKARNHQRIVLENRKKRKQERQNAKPVATPQQKKIRHNNEKIKHYEDLIKKAETKIKSLRTRTKTYEKRIKYHKKQIDSVIKSASQPSIESHTQRLSK